MEPVYRNIEFCSKPDTLWGKLREGRWDWLGVRKDGQFVLGSPPRQALTDHVALTKSSDGAEDGRHGDRAITDPNRAPSDSWFASPEEAAEEFAALVAEYESKEGPLLIKVQLIRDAHVVDTVFVVNNPPTYGVWRPPPEADQGA